MAAKSADHLVAKMELELAAYLAELWALLMAEQRAYSLVVHWAVWRVDHWAAVTAGN